MRWRIAPPGVCQGRGCMDWAAASTFRTRGAVTTIDGLGPRSSRAWRLPSRCMATGPSRGNSTAATFACMAFTSTVSAAGRHTPVPGCVVRRMSRFAAGI